MSTSDAPVQPDDELRVVWTRLANQRIRGVWWPHTRDVVRELALLLPAADDYLGAPLVRATFNPLQWDHRPKRLYVADRLIRVAWFDSLDPSLVEIAANPMEPVLLCLAPPEWDAAAGHGLLAALRDATAWSNSPEQLLQSGAGGATAPAADVHAVEVDA